MTIRLALIAWPLIALSLRMAGLSAPPPRPDPFGFLEPAIQLSDEDRRRIDERGIIVKILPADGHELATLVTGSLTVGHDALLASARNIVELKKSALVPQVGRFSSEPRLEDVRELTLDDVDVNEIRRCRPQRCGLKLAPDEIARLHQALSAHPEDSKAALNVEFRRIMVARAAEYLHHGDRRTQREFSALIEHSPKVDAWIPRLETHLERYPSAPLAGAESFLYWSKETYAWKPMISITHVTMVRASGEGGAPDVVIASRDVFVTRYTSGSFVLTLLFPGDTDASRWHLVYLNRTWVDGLRGQWRPFVEHRVKSQARKVFADTRGRIERHRAVAASK